MEFNKFLSHIYPQFGDKIISMLIQKADDFPEFETNLRYLQCYNNGDGTITVINGTVVFNDFIDVRGFGYISETISNENVRKELRILFSTMLNSEKEVEKVVDFLHCGDFACSIGGRELYIGIELCNYLNSGRIKLVNNQFYWVKNISLSKWAEDYFNQFHLA